MENCSMECPSCNMVHRFLDCKTNRRWYEDQSVIKDFWEITHKLRCPGCKIAMQLPLLFLDRPLKKCITCDFCNHSYCSKCLNSWTVNEDHSCSENQEGIFDKQRKQLLKNLLKRSFHYSEKCKACDENLQMVDQNLDVIQIGLSVKIHDYFYREIKDLVKNLKLVRGILNCLKGSFIYAYYKCTGEAEEVLNSKQERVSNLVVETLELYRRIREEDLSSVEFSSLLSKLHLLGRIYGKT